jgi:hypothetical protein
MTNTEQLIAHAKTASPNLPDDEIVRRLIDIGAIKRGYSIEHDVANKQLESGRTALVGGFAVLKDGIVFFRSNSEFEAQRYLENLRNADATLQE